MRAKPSIIALLMPCAVAWGVTSAGAQPPLRPDDGVPAAFDVVQRDDVHCAHEDGAGFLWICTDQGLGRFDGHDLTTFGREAGELRAFVRDRDGRVWVGGRTGLYEFVMAPPGRQPYLRPAAPRADRAAVRALVRGRDGSVFAATGTGVLRLANGTLEAVDLGGPSMPPPERVDAVLEDESGAVWAGTPEGLYLRTAEGARHRFTTADGLPADEVRALALDEAGRLWAATARGLALISSGLADIWMATVSGARVQPRVRSPSPSRVITPRSAWMAEPSRYRPPVSIA